MLRKRLENDILMTGRKRNLNLRSSLPIIIIPIIIILSHFMRQKSNFYTPWDKSKSDRCSLFFQSSIRY